MRKISLVKLQENQKAKVVEIAGGEALKLRMMSMGVYPGKEITKLNNFALRGPVTVKIGRTVLAVGYGMASKILVELI